MAGDRRMSNGSGRYSDNVIKIFQKGDMLIGIAGNSGQASLITNMFDFKITATDDLVKDIYRDIIPELRSLLKDYGIVITRDGVDDTASTILIAMRGSLFIISGFKVIELPNIYAIGSGNDHAEGSLYTSLKHFPKKDPTDLIRLSIQTAIDFNNKCGGEIDILSLSYGSE